MAPTNLTVAGNVHSVLPPVIKYGKYKGRSDTRGQRCLHPPCNRRGIPSCRYCKALPYESSNLKTESKPEEVSNLADRLGLILELDANYPELNRNGLQIRGRTMWSLSFVRARIHMNRLASSFGPGSFGPASSRIPPKVCTNGPRIKSRQFQL